MKYFFDKNLLDYLSLELKAYDKIEILNSILDNDNIWTNINGRIILSNQIINIIKNKYPSDSKIPFRILFDTPGYWKNHLNKGFKISALYKIIDSCVIDNFDKYYNLDKGLKVMNLEI